MKSNDILIGLLLSPFIGACFFLVISLIYIVEPSYVNAKNNNPMGYLNEPGGSVFMLLPAEFMFSLVGFTMLSIFIDPVLALLNIDADFDEIQELLVFWCPIGIVSAVLMYRFVKMPSIYFLNRYDYLGILIVLILIVKLIPVVKKMRY